MDNDHKYSGCHELVPVRERTGMGWCRSFRGTARAAQVFCLLENSLCAANQEASAMVKGITSNYAMFSSERICGITFLANFQFFSFVQT